MIVLIVLSLKVPRENLRMSRRALVNCQRCKDPIRKDKMVVVQTLPNNIHPMIVCKHCRSILVMQLRELEKVALLAD